MCHSLYGFPEQWSQGNVYRKPDLTISEVEYVLLAERVEWRTDLFSSPPNFTRGAICQVVEDIAAVIGSPFASGFVDNTIFFKTMDPSSPLSVAGR